MSEAQAPLRVQIVHGRTPVMTEKSVGAAQAEVMRPNCAEDGLLLLLLLLLLKG